MCLDPQPFRIRVCLPFQGVKFNASISRFELITIYANHHMYGTPVNYPIDSISWDELGRDGID